MNANPFSPDRSKDMLARLRQSARAEPRGVPVGPVALSPEQRTLLSADMLHRGQPVANLVRSWDLQGPLDIAALNRALASLVGRHDALRMSITRSDGGPMPTFAAEGRVSLDCEAVQGGTPDARLAEIDRLIEGESLSPFAPDAPVLWRARLFKVGGTRHVLAVVMHHLICDDWSWRILARDLFSLYDGEITGAPAGLPEAAAFAAHLARRAGASCEGEAQAHPEIHWPTATYSLPDHEAVRRERVTRHLDADAEARLRDVARIHGCTAFTILLAAYEFLLGTYCDQNTFRVALSPSDRTAPGEEHSIGLFVRNIEVGTNVGTCETFADLMLAARHELRSALARDADPIHLGRAAIGYYNAPDLGLGSTALTVAQRPDATAAQSANLHLSLHPGPDGMTITFAGQRSHFSETVLAQLADCYLLILRQVIRNPGVPLSEIDLVDQPEAQRQARRAHAPETGGTDLDILAQFAFIARAHPEATALATPGKAWTYADLDRETNALAHWLLSKGLRAGERLGVVMPRSAAVFKVWLAALKAGLTVVPVASGLPALRMRHVLGDAGCSALISPAGAYMAEASSDLPRLQLHLQMPTPSDLGAMPDTPPDLASRAPDRDAFVMFTSGTTGLPKGLPVPHAGLVRLALGAWYFPIGPGDRMSQFASCGFDGSFIEVWCAWLKGAALVLCEKDILAEGGISSELKRLAPTASFMTTSLFNMLVDADPTVFAPLTHLAIGGETASASHCRRALDANPSLRLFNGYGPTENSALSTGHAVSSDVPSNVPIGRPLPGNLCPVLSSRRRLVPDGFAGELFVGGPGLSQGYENRPEVRAERFIAVDPERLGLDADDSIPLYRTGDRVRWTSDGDLEFLGRRDTQFKLHGHRVEPTEIEAALMAHPAIGRAAVLPERRNGGTAVTGIAAYIEAVHGDLPSDRDLRSFLADRIPRPILPTRYVRVQALPLTVNGKVDLAAVARQQPDPQSAADIRSDDPLTAIWQDILGHTDIPDTGDFYALGGTSLQLVQMILEVQKVFGADVDFGTFSDEPTLRRLRVLIAMSPELHASDRKHLRLLRGGRADLSPIVLMPAVNGQFAWAVEILTALSVENPVLGLRFDPPRELPLPESFLAELIESLLDDLSAHGADRPVTLVGYSFGGTLAGHVATRAAERGIALERIVMLDSSSPLARLGASAPQSIPQALAAQVFRHPAGPVTCQCDFITATRSFPYPKSDSGEGWSYFVSEPLREHLIDALHHHLMTPHFAPAVARLIEGIVAGQAEPDCLRQSRYEPATIDKVNAIKENARKGRFCDATLSLKGLIPEEGDIPAWIVVGLVDLFKLAGRPRKLRALLEMSERFASPEIWWKLANAGFAPSLDMLRRAYDASGPALGCALPLAMRLARTGRDEEARKILDALRRDPGFTVEAGIAEGALAAISGDVGAARAAMETALMSPLATGQHATWSATVLARQGQPDVAAAFLASQARRFPEEIAKARAKIELIASSAVERRGDVIPENVPVPA
ncbi:amino acid adenylation domain-containing protein [Salipiger sp. H15]|uniref:Amino acid adenylation domain-containing protein n=1 Tax=Alloyangia sp. H15 TaxID=3029062 RepID=A0AAU8APR1_9RHOB